MKAIFVLMEPNLSLSWGTIGVWILVGHNFMLQKF